MRRKHPKKRITKEKVEEFLEKHPRFKLLTWSGDATKKKSEFFDTIENRPFWMTFVQFKNDLRRRPNRSYGLTKSEVAHRRMVSYIEKNGKHWNDGAGDRNEAKFGVRSTLLLPHVKEKWKKKMLELYGTEHPMHVPGLKNKAKRTNLERYGTEHALQNPQIKAKADKTKMEKFGTTNMMLVPELVAKQQKSLLESHGVTNPMKSAEIKERHKAYFLEEYGVENPSQVPEINEKRLKGFQEKFGGNSPMCSPEVREESRKTSLQNWGVPYPAQSPVVRAKTEATNTKKYNVKCPLTLPENRQKNIQQMIDSGKMKLVDGKTSVVLAKEKGVTRPWMNTIIRTIKDPKVIRMYNRSKSSIETIIAEILERHGIGFVFDRMLPDASFRIQPDFRIESPKRLIIEADGNYFHSDFFAKNTPESHQKRKNEYRRLGYDCLFFREHEILEKREIVESIILDRLGLLPEIDVHECERVFFSGLGDASFFAENHLLGAPSPDSPWLAMIHDGEIVAALSFAEEENMLRIGRFCAARFLKPEPLFSELFDAIITEARGPKGRKPISFVLDGRFENPEMFSSSGFEKKAETLSFVWTAGTKVFSPERFNDDSGLKKLWCCGQEEWVW